MRLSLIACLHLMLACTLAAAEVRIAGSSTVANTLILPQREAIEAAADVRLMVSSSGSKKGLLDLAAGDADLAMISAPLASVVAKILAERADAIDAVGLVAHPLGSTAVVFVVHPDNPVHAITTDQLRGVLSGAISSWAALGGPERPIVVVAERSGGGIRSVVEAELLAPGSTLATPLEVATAPHVVQLVARTPDAIGLSTRVHATDLVIALDVGLELKQPLILVSRGEPDAVATKVIAAALAAAGGD